MAEKNLPGKPDIVLPKYRTVIFVHGCFWHGHGCRFFKWPRTRPAFWRKKIKDNRVIDLKTREKLRAAGWRVGVVWECAIRGADKDIGAVSVRIRKWLHSNKRYMEIRG